MTSPLDDRERAELERLRSEVTRLRERPRRRVGRWSLSVLLLFLAALLTALSGVAVFARNEVLDTDRFVANLAPLARDDDVRDAVAQRVTDAVTKGLDIEGLTQRALAAIETKGAPDILDALADPIASGIESFVSKQVDAIIHSEQFEDLWATAIREVHASLHKILTGQPGELLDVQDGKIVVDLAPVFDTVKQRLVDNGFAVAAKLPTVSVTYPLMDAAPVKQARTAATVLNAVAWVLPFTALALLIAGVLIAPDRRRGLLVGALLTAGAMLALWGGLWIARTAYLGALPDTVRSPRAAAALFDIGVRFLVGAAQTAAVLFGLVALGSWLAGPGRFATGLRRVLAGLFGAIARGVDRFGLPLTGFAGAVHRNRRAIELVLLVLGLLWLVLWGHPGIPGTLTVTAVVCLAIAVTEICARLNREPPEAGVDETPKP